jgi:hypothetical protein
LALFSFQGDKSIRMKKLLIVCAIFSGVIADQEVSAQEYKMGLGIRLSTAQAVVNNSVSFKYFITETNALEGLLSFDPLAIGALYEVHRPLGAPGFQWLYGAGAYVAFEGESNFGVMGVVGLDYKFQSIPINLTLDWKPELNFVQDIFFEPAAIGLSIRFAFR